MWLPVYMILNLGMTMDLRKSTTAIGNINADHDEVPLNELNAKYIVLPEEGFPYSYFGIPIDEAIRQKLHLNLDSFTHNGLRSPLYTTTWKYDSVTVAFSFTYNTFQRNLKNDSFIDNWQNRIPKSQTHYVGSLVYGGRCLAFMRFKCQVSSDMKTIRRKIVSIFGEHGTYTNETLDKWYEVINAIRNDSKIRGKVEMKTYDSKTDLPGMLSKISDPESWAAVLKDLPKASKSVEVKLFGEMKLLHQLDESFDFVQEDTKYKLVLERVDAIYDDLMKTRSAILKWKVMQTLLKNEDKERLSKLVKAIDENYYRVYSIMRSASLFKPEDSKELDRLFNSYREGISDEADTYYMTYKRLREDIDAVCEDVILNKMKGLLNVYEKEKENIGKVEGGLKDCSKKCFANKRCRAIGYADEMIVLEESTGQYIKNQKICIIYYRSSETAKVETPAGISGDVGVYDRKCILENVYSKQESNLIK